MSERIRIAVVEDDAGLRETFQQIFGSATDFRVVGAFGDGETALQQLPAKAPAVVLMDINLPGISGIDCLRQLKATLPKVRVIMVTVYDDDDRLFQSLVAGADGYLLKRATRLRLLDAVREIVGGGAPISPQVARRMAAAGQTPSQTYAVPVSRDRIVLTVGVPGGAEGTVTVLNGGLARITPTGQPTIGLVPAWVGTGVRLGVFLITPKPGGEAVHQVGTVVLTLVQPGVVEAAGVLLGVTWAETKPPTPAPLQPTGCTICCLTCHGLTICACEVVMDCGRCCCPDGCGCSPDEIGTEQCHERYVVYNHTDDRKAVHVDDLQQDAGGPPRPGPTVRDEEKDNAQDSAARSRGGDSTVRN